MSTTASRHETTAPVAWLEEYPVDELLSDATVVARDLLGRCIVRRSAEGSRIVMRIVETEAYLGAIDRASHAFGDRRTKRTATLFQKGGCWYVYLIYGMYYCLNVVAHTQDSGHAVLIRAGEIIGGNEHASINRTVKNTALPGALAGGPGKLCQALRIDKAFDARPVWDDGLALTLGEAVLDGDVAIGPRIGIDYAGDAAHWPLRFAIKGHREMSRPQL